MTTQMTSKRLKASLVAIICSSFVVWGTIWWVSPDTETICKIFDMYKWIVWVALGGYQLSQTITDKKKIENGNGS